jgi:hypothetical protein
MKKICLILNVSLTSFVGESFADTKTTTATLKGTKIGTETSTTINSDGSVTLKANCDNSSADCASVTIETKSTSSTQRVEVKVWEGDGVRTYRGFKTMEMPFSYTDNSIEVNMFL